MWRGNVLSGGCDYRSTGASVGDAGESRNPPWLDTPGVHLFVLGVSADGGADPERAAAALETLRAPFFAGEPVERWAAPSGRVAVASLAHAPERLGGARYRTVSEHRIALFAGRPIAWDGERADGRAPLDPAFYLGDPADWAPRLDGRFAALRYDDRDGALHAVTDRLGAYPLFRGRAGGVQWLSNSPAALARLCAARELDRDALAGVLGGGWSLAGGPLWAGIERLAWGVVHRHDAAGWTTVPLTTDADVAALCGAGLDAARAARLLVAATAALADWPGRPSVVLVTGGRDSRLILAAARRAGIDFSARTGGAPDAPDVVLGRRLAEAAGVPHALLDPHPHGDFQAHWQEMAATLARTTGGTATLADAAGFPLGPNSPAPAPLPLWHTGQGGEIARGYYGAGGGDPVQQLERAFTGRRPGRSAPLSAPGEARVREQIAAWARGQRAAGARKEDLPDLFYLTRRMATWAAPSHAAVEPIRDSTSPLWSFRLLGDMLGLPAGVRAREGFHLQVLRELAPELVDLPFEGDRPWPSRQSAVGRRARRARALAGKALAEARRRTARAPVPAATAPAEPLDRVLAELREAVAAQPGHAAWDVLDRERVDDLLAGPAASLDAMRRAYVWRLATVFGADWAGR